LETKVILYAKKAFFCLIFNLLQHYHSFIKNMIRIAVFASGKGSNAQQIIHYFRDNKRVEISFIVSSKKDAGVLNIAATHKIPSIVLDKKTFLNTDEYVVFLKENKIDFIVLAGFLWKIPVNLIQAYPQKIINIHPALLPNYGGKGMYGHFVHEAVIAAKEKQSGITIHYVDELYDHGAPVFQAFCDIDENDTPDTLAEKIHVLEHTHFPAVIEKVLFNL